MRSASWRAAVIGLVTLVAASVAGPASGDAVPAWEPAIPVSELPGSHPDVNTEFLDGCPIQSPDGLSLYMASNRPGGVGLLDIWVAHRDTGHRAGVRRRTRGSRSTPLPTTSAPHPSGASGC